MPEYDNTNRGVLFKNSTKKSPTHADYSGKLNVDGRDYFLDAWIKTGAKGKFLSMSVKLKNAKPATAAKTPVQNITDMTDDIPF